MSDTLSGEYQNNRIGCEDPMDTIDSNPSDFLISYDIFTL